MIQHYFSQPILDLPRYTKRFIVIMMDANLCVLAVWLAFFLRLDEWIRISGDGIYQPFWAVVASLLLALPLFISHGFYRVIFRYSGLSAITTIIRVFGLYSLLYATLVTAIGLPGVPRSVGIIQPLLLFILVSASRLWARYWLGSKYQNQLQIAALPKALIYGAGSAGRQLAAALDNSYTMLVVGFLDDNVQLQGHVLNGQPVFAPARIEKLIESRGVTHVLLAMTSINRHRRNEILKHMGRYRVAVHTLPSLSDLAEGVIAISDLRELDIDDLLGREPVPPDHVLLNKNIIDKVVLVTGAGGSIGSELCRQILKFNPKKLLLIDLSEFALYSIHAELESLQLPASDHLGALVNGHSQQLIPLLASVQDQGRMQEIMHTWHPDTVYHAAAYKHVPMVECNLVEGVKNNVLGTLIAAQAAIENAVANFVLISTDKAVRPTNVMGASKRLAEMCLQALSDKSTVSNGQMIVENEKQRRTTLSMVRFGNVLGSSGSVIPKFRQQIRDGGPITLTHPEINRFFMTIPEAAQLVIQAGAMAQGGDVFVLDMGEPVMILDFARRMVKLSGLTVQDADNPEGDIEITITGLRPGEKLHEELLLGDDPYPTPHPRILRAQDPFVPWEQLEIEITTMRTASERHDANAILVLLKKLVAGYQPSNEVENMVAETRD